MAYYEDITRAAHLFAKGGTTFGEVVTASVYPLIDLKSIYGISNLRDDVTTTNSATVTNTDGKYVLATGGTASSSAELDSVERGRYIAGADGVPGIAVRLPSLPTGEQEARWGYYDDNDGFGVGIDATGLFTFLRNGGTETINRRDNWKDDLEDLDITQVNVFRFPFRWYGSGPVLFEVTTNGNTLFPDLTRFDVRQAPDGEPLVRDPNLPIRAEVINQGTASDFQLEVFGRQFGIIGGYNPNRRFTSDFRLAQSISTTFVPLVTFKQKPAFASVSVKAGGTSILTGNDDVIFQLRIDGSLTGASYAAPTEIDASETALEFDKSATAITGGQKIYEGVVAAGQGSSAGASSQDIPTVDLPVNQPVTLCARGVSGSATVTSVLRAREEW